MRSKILAGAAAAALAFGIAGSASAATYVSIVDWWNVGGLNQVGTPFGEVVLEEAGDGKTINVTATIFGDDTWQQSGGNALFAFNLADDGATVVTENHSTPDVEYNPTSYTHAPWGTFTDHFTIDASGKNGRIDPIQFTVFNANGLTFAGLGATFDIDGRLATQGTGNRFTSNANGFWFFGHYQPMDGDESDGDSENIGAKDAFCLRGCTTPAPEPDAWALMILGFGGAGAALRSRRHRLTPA